MAKMVKREVLIGTIQIGNKTVRAGENVTVDEDTADALADDGILAREPAKVAPKTVADDKDDDSLMGAGADKLPGAPGAPAPVPPLV